MWKGVLLETLEYIVYNINLERYCFSLVCIFKKGYQVFEVMVDVPKAMGRLGIRGTQVKSSIQDIVDEVAPIKKPPYGVEGRFI